jgi:hypothetical protein
MKLLVKRVLVMAFLIFFGCTLQHTPSEQRIDPARLPPFKPVAPVKLTNAQDSVENVSVPTVAATISVNYRDFTQLAIKLLKNELEKHGSTVQESAAKEIKLAIVDLKLLPLSTSHKCLINYTVVTGEGYVRGLEAMGESWNIQTAIDTAITNVAIGVLNDEQILDYLEK